MTPDQIDRLCLHDLRISVATERGYRGHNSINTMPDYTNSWELAGALVEEMQPGHDIHIKWRMVQKSPQVWRVEMYGPLHIPQKYYDGDGDTLPEAVARAWLKWMAGR